MSKTEPEPGRDLDARVEEVVMLRRVKWHNADPYSQDKQRGQRSTMLVPHYSTDIAAAWSLIEHFLNVGMWATVFSVYDPDGTLIWMCLIDAGPSGGEVSVGSGESAPLAICRAALPVVEPRSLADLPGPQIAADCPNRDALMSLVKRQTSRRADREGGRE